MKIGELFAGYGGLGMGLQAVLGGELAWYSDLCRTSKSGVGHFTPHKAPCSILEHHYPGVPNHGDITRIDWNSVEPVDVITAGFPCQDLSHAGKQKGLREGTRSGLWANTVHAIDHLKPQLVLIENVRGLLSGSTAESEEVRTRGPQGGVKVGRTNRAIGRVLGDLADLGYHAAWRGVRASDVGAPHVRFRVFILAWPASADADNAGWGEQWWASPAPAQHAPAERPGALLPTPRTGDANGPRPARTGTGLDLRSAVALLPTETRRLEGVDWGKYTGAIHEWESLTRPAPAPTYLTDDDRTLMDPRFPEWMMGLPDGWVTGTPGITRNAALKALGNGVCPQQAAFAVADLLRSVPSSIINKLTETCSV